MYKVRKIAKFAALLLTFTLMIALLAIPVTVNAAKDNDGDITPNAYLFCPAHYKQLVRESGYVNDLGWVSKYVCPTPGCNYYVWVQE